MTFMSLDHSARGSWDSGRCRKRAAGAITESGTVGAGGSGVAVLSSCEGRYLRPEPRTRLGMLLGRNRAATACMDLSDGLADAVRQVAAASELGMIIDAAALPIDDAVSEWHRARGHDPALEAVAGGDDYELLFTAGSRPPHRGRLRAVRAAGGDVPLTRIGVVTKGGALVLRTAHGDRELPAGFEHFK